MPLLLGFVNFLARDLQIDHARAAPQGLLSDDDAHMRQGRNDHMSTAYRSITPAR
jgi:hypothetical protein